MKIAVLDIYGVQITLEGMLQYYYRVDDNYDFIGNSATDVTSFNTVDLFINTNRINYVEYRKWLIGFDTGNTFSALTQYQKEVLSKNFSTSKINRDFVFTSIEQDNFAVVMQEFIGAANVHLNYASASSGYTSSTGITTTVDNKLILDSLSATTISGGTLYSGSTNLYDIFSTGGGGSTTYVQPGSNITTGGTATNPIISVVASPSFNNLTASGYTDTMTIVEPVSPSASGTVRFFSETTSGLDNPAFKDFNGSKFRLFRDTIFTLTNQESTILNPGEVVYINSGVSGTSAFIKRAQANTESTSGAFGVVVNPGGIASGARGRVMRIGRTEVSGINTSAFTAGDIVYVSPSVAGGLTNLKPELPYIPQEIGIVIIAHATSGSVLVDIQAPKPRDLENAYLKSWVRWRASNSTISATGSGGGLFGTPAKANNGTTNYTSLTTGNAAGNFAGVESSSFAEIRGTYNPTMTVVMSTSSDITTQRLWFGFFSVTLANTDNQTGSNVAFRFSTVAGDGGWRPIVDDGTTQTLGTAIGTVSASTQYKLVIRINSAEGKSYFSVNGGVEQVVNAIPTSTTEMGFIAEMTNTATGARSFNFSRLEVIHN